jgi:hypothetical protein
MENEGLGLSNEDLELTYFITTNKYMLHNYILIVLGKHILLKQSTWRLSPQDAMTRREGGMKSVGVWDEGICYKIDTKLCTFHSTPYENMWECRNLALDVERKRWKKTLNVETRCRDEKM